MTAPTPRFARTYPPETPLRLPAGGWRLILATVLLLLLADVGAAALTTGTDFPTSDGAAETVVILASTVVPAVGALVLVVVAVAYRQRNGRCSALGFTAEGVWVTTGATPFSDAHGRALLVPWAYVERLDWTTGLLGPRCAVKAAETLPYAGVLLPGSRAYARLWPGRSRRVGVQQRIAELSAGRFLPAP